MSRQLIYLIAVFLMAGLVQTSLGNGLDPNLVAWWSFDEGAGNIAADGGPSGIDGALTNGPEWRTQGRRDGCLFFDGADDYVLVANQAALNPGSDSFTITFWANVDTVAGTVGDTTWDLAVGKRDSGSDGYYIGALRTQGTADQAGYRFMLGNTSATRLDTPYVLVSLGEWAFVTAVLDRAADVHKISVDGGLTWATATPPAAPIAPDHDLSLGGDLGMNNYWFHGLIDDVAFFNRALTDAETARLMTLGLTPGLARDAHPARGATDVPADVVLSWTAGLYAVTHDVYLGTNYDDVANASRTTPLDVLRAEGISNSAYDPGRLEFGQTYYWRIDEVNGAPDNTIYKGNVWNFTTEPLAYPVQNVQVTSNGTTEAGQEPENTVNGSGLNANDGHSYDGADMWLAAPPADSPLWIQYEFDGIYKLHQAQVWNYNVQFEPMLGFGIQNATVEYSADGLDWTVLGDVELAQAPGQMDYVYGNTIDFAGAAVKYVKLTVNSGYGADKHGLSEIRFLFIPAYAREPEPADGATDVSVATALSWRPGRGAAVHEVYLGPDPDSLPLVDTVQTGTYQSPDGLDLSTTYYWQIVEVNDAEETTAWPGDLWSFSTEEYITVDDFESYTGNFTDGEAIWQTWLDGYEDPTNGSQVGYIIAPFIEPTIIHGGGQSMPLIYDNTGASYAEAKRSFDPPQNWAQYGIEALTLYFRGSADNQGQLYVTINNLKVPYDRDASDIAKLTWQTWNIDLSAVGTDLTNVRSMGIGIDGANVAGTLFVDDIRLYREPPLAPREPNNAYLIAHYALEGDAADVSGNGHDGQVNGNPTFVTGMAGQALEFDGFDDYVRIADDARLNPGDGDFSISFWAQLNPNPGTSGTTTWDLAVNKRQTGSRGYYVGAYRPQGAEDEAGFKFMLGNTSGQRVDTPYMIVPLGEWVFVTAVLDRTENVHKISVNGGHTWATATPPSGTIAPAVDLGLGFDIGPDNYWFHGTMDEVRLYNTALTNEEAAWLANN